MFLKYSNIISKIKRSKVTDYAALTESNFTRNNIYESVENVIKQNDSDKCFDDSGYLAPMCKNVV